MSAHASTNICALHSFLHTHKVKKLRYRASGVTLGTSTTGSNGNDRNAISKARTKREEEMHQARLRQQEILNQKAKEALEQKRELLKKKPLLDHDSSSNLDPTNGDSNQTNSTTTKKYTTKPSSQSKTIPSSGYNPMQPWSASTGGGTYR